MTKVYLDACCLNRPFDDQTQDRVRLEAEAVLLVLSHVERGDWQWVSSAVVEFELQQTPDPERRRRTVMLAREASTILLLTPEIEARGNALGALGFTAYDALHIAAAEAADVTVFLTTDDRLLRVAKRVAQQLRVQVANPLTWMQEAEEQ